MQTGVVVLGKEAVSIGFGSGGNNVDRGELVKVEVDEVDAVGVESGEVDVGVGLASALDAAMKLMPVEIVNTGIGDIVYMLEGAGKPLKHVS